MVGKFRGTHRDHRILVSPGLARPARQPQRCFQPQRRVSSMVFVHGRLIITAPEDGKNIGSSREIWDELRISLVHMVKLGLGPEFVIDFEGGSV